MTPVCHLKPISEAHLLAPVYSNNVTEFDDARMVLRQFHCVHIICLNIICAF